MRLHLHRDVGVRDNEVDAHEEPGDAPEQHEDGREALGVLLFVKEVDLG